jgi:hypothetical protein
VEQIDNTAFLLAAAEIQDVAKAVIQRLTTGIKGEQQIATAKMICFVIETQSDAIKRLVEYQLELTDRLEETLRKIEEKKL